MGRQRQIVGLFFHLENVRGCPIVVVGTGGHARAEAEPWSEEAGVFGAEFFSFHGCVAVDLVEASVVGGGGAYGE